MDITMTDVALREYLERFICGKVDRLDVELKAVRAATDAAFMASQKAIDKAEAALGARLEGMNEIRGQLETQADTFARADVVNAALKSLSDRLDREFSLVGTRLGIIERFQSRLLGGLLLAPIVSSIITGVVVYAVTH